MFDLTTDRVIEELDKSIAETSDALKHLIGRLVFV